MPTTPATTLPAMSNGQTGADLAMSNGISQADYMKAEAASPGLNPDAIIGNIMSARARNAAVAPTKAAPLPPPVTVTSDPARAKFNQDSQALDALQNNRNAAAVQAQSSQNGRVTYADGSYQNAGAVGSQYMRFDANGAPLGYGAYEAPTQGGQEGKVRTPEEQQLLDLSTSYQNEYDSIKSKLDQAQATADQYNADLIQNIKDSYAQRKAQMERINAGLVGQTTQAGIRAGRNIYAPEMEAGMISSAELDGAQRLAALDAEEKNLILQAQMAKSDKDMERLSKSMDALEANNNRKRQAILDLHQIQKDTEDSLMARMQEKREEAKFQFEVEQAKLKPILELEQEERDLMHDISVQFPSAMIDITDTLESANQKLLKDPMYQASLAYEKAKAAAEQSGGKISDTTIRSFAQGLLQSGLATSPYEADQLARDYYANGYVPEQKELGAGAKSLVEGAQRLASRNSEAQQGALMRSVNQKIEAGDILGATMDVFTNAYAGLPATQQEKAFGYVQGLNDLDDIETLLSEFKAEGGDTGILSGSLKDIQNKLKKSANPKLQEIGDRVTLAMSNYRKAQSGAAFTESEERLYKAAFPSTFGSESFNAAKIKSLRDAFSTGLKSQLQTVLGADVYGKMETMRKAETMRPELEQLAKTKGYEAEDIKELIKAGKSADEISSFLNRSKKVSVGSGTNNAPDIKRVVAAIGQFESGGNYKAQGPTVTSGMYKGDHAYGKYQVMGKNVPSWTKEALGRSMTPEQFLNDPKAQDAVAEHYMGMHLSKYGNVGDVASVWFTGKPLAKAGNVKDVIGTSAPQYVKNVQAIYDRLS